MKITCTTDEKRRMKRILEDTDYCPFVDEDEKCLEDDDTGNQFNCEDCMLNRIEWDIQDGGNGDE